MDAKKSSLPLIVRRRALPAVKRTIKAQIAISLGEHYLLQALIFSSQVGHSQTPGPDDILIGDFLMNEYRSKARSRSFCVVGGICLTRSSPSRTKPSLISSMVGSWW